MYRSRQVGGITYNLWFGLDAKNEDFQGRTVIRFDLKERAAQHISTLRLDFTGGKIETFVVNGEAWSADKVSSRYDGSRVELKISELAKGQNRIEIAYAHPYSKTGNGFYRFKDPLDQKVYLYTNFEPYYANQLFPCFDQPDLKASYEVTVEAPEEWQIISNMPEREKNKLDGRMSWQFPPSPVFSTYLFALMAGPYKSWKDDADGIPLRLFARESLAKHVDPADWFRVTKKGLEFFSDYFGVPYPYGKYDQILVPDFNAGAMENVGAITFTENFVYQSRPTEDDKKDRADTILHEMAHQWFGNLVTMRWWNGLWLNESFATYLASVAMECTKLYPGATQGFFSGMKRWAYAEDSLVTTHPVETSVLDTSVAFSNFDGITYGKGASALKQLHFWLGDDDFKEGLHRYFLKYANRNTALADFMNSMAQSSGQSLTTWQTAWLQTTGINTLETAYTCGENKRIESFTLTQSAGSEGNTLRPHRTRIALYYKTGDGSLLKSPEVHDVTYTGAETAVPLLIGKKCPDFVFPNDADYDYVKVSLDAHSLKSVLDSMNSMSDSLTRHILWHTLWEMVKDGKLPADEYASAVVKHLPREKNKTILSDVASTMSSSRVGGLTVAKILPAEDRLKFMSLWHGLARREFEKQPARSDMQKIWFEAAMSSVGDTASAEWALSIATGKQKYLGITKDQESEWAALRAAARLIPVEEGVFEKMAAADPSEQGKTFLWQTRASLPLETAEKEFAGYFLKETEPKNEDLKPARLRRLMRAYLSLMNEDRTARWGKTYFEKLTKISGATDETYASSFASALFPSTCAQSVVDQATNWLSKNTKSHPDVVKEIKQNRQIEEWCIRARANLKKAPGAPAKLSRLSNSL